MHTGFFTLISSKNQIHNLTLSSHKERRVAEGKRYCPMMRWLLHLLLFDISPLLITER